MDICGIDHVEFYVADADKTASYLCGTFGFGVRGYGGPETGLAQCHSVVLSQREITVVVTSALDDSHPAAGYVRQHGDGVAAIGMNADDAPAAFAEAVERGTTPVSEPAVAGRAGEQVFTAAVAGPGDIIYRFVTRDTADMPFAPGSIKETVAVPGADEGMLRAVDHVALCVTGGGLADSVRCYEEAFGFATTFEDHIVVGSQAMNSKALRSPSGAVTFVILEPDTSREAGRIDEFLSAHGGPGVQHLAFLTEDIVRATRGMISRGLRFLPTPTSYYLALPGRLGGSVDIPVEELQKLGILADKDEWGTLFQIFTESRHLRRTFFWELIDRRGARTFGNDNITALYEAVERDMSLNSH